MSNSIVEKIKELIEELPTLPSGKKFREREKIKLHDNGENICLVCHKHVYNKDCPYEPYGCYRSETMLQHIYMFLEHLKVYAYESEEKKFFIDSVLESKILEGNNMDKAWFFNHVDNFDTFEVKERKDYKCFWDSDEEEHD